MMFPRPTYGLRTILSIPHRTRHVKGLAVAWAHQEGCLTAFTQPIIEDFGGEPARSSLPSGPPGTLPRRTPLEREVVARGAADRAAGARACARVGARRAEGWIARLRLGEAVLARDGLVVRDRALGADRVTCARSLAGGREVAFAGAREDRSGLAAGGPGAPLCFVA